MGYNFEYCMKHDCNGCKNSRWCEERGKNKVEDVKVIKVNPDKNGNIFIKLYGTKYKIEIEEKEAEPTKAKKSTGKSEK